MAEIQIEHLFLYSYSSPQCFCFSEKLELPRGYPLLPITDLSFPSKYTRTRKHFSKQHGSFTSARMGSKEDMFFSQITMI